MDEKNIKILIVDDENDFRQLMKSWFEGKGYFVIEASDGQAALKAVKEGKPDIVFMDLRMPVMDGVDAIKGIRSFEKELPIIVISAYLQDARIKEAMPYDISGVFCKTNDFQEGLNLLEVALRIHKKFKK